MINIGLLVGNGINSISNGVNWFQLLNNIMSFCQCDYLKYDKSKPFPLFYEEIFLTALKTNAIKNENSLKQFIADEVSKIQPNPVHLMLRNLSPAHIMTTNYEFLLEGRNPGKNTGIVKERLYSVFRNFICDNVTYWHIHGDCNNPDAINLGFEHYSGQIQKMRNYVTSNPDYSSNSLAKGSMIQRLKAGSIREIQSWIDLFFTIDIHIIGMTLDFVESDIWWLLTYRARQQQINRIPIRNEIFYYIPKSYCKGDTVFKLNLLKVNGVKIIEIDKPHGINYYEHLISNIS